MKEEVNFFPSRFGNLPLNAPAPHGSLQLAKQIAHVRAMAQRSLNRFNSASEMAGRETILLSDGHLAGFKFSLGVFHAHWLINEAALQIFREQQHVTSVAIDGTQENRRAA